MSSSAAEPHVTVGPPRTEEISDGIYAYIQPDGGWWINNAGFLVTSRGAISIDSTSTQRRTEAYRDAISHVCAGPVHTLVNTHHHGDHTNGNYQFAGATIVGHQRCRDQILAVGPPGPRQALTWDGPEWGDIALAPPFLTYTDEVQLWADELCCHVRYIGTPAHTTNDSIVWIADRSVLFAGDLVINGGTPFLLAGSLSGSISAIESLKSLNPQVIVPGHGNTCGPGVLDDVLDYLRFVTEYASRAHVAGLSPLEAARACDLGRYAALLDSERIVGNLYRAYSELAENPVGTPVDMRSALADMVSYNGGTPLTCLA